MNNKMTKLKIFVFALILVFYGLFLIHNINLYTEDLGRFLKSGEIFWQQKDIMTQNVFSYTEPNSSTILAPQWLFSAIVSFLFKNVGLGFNGLIIFKTVLLLFAFSVLFFTATKKANFWLVAFLSLPTVLILSGRSDIRPEIFSYLFIIVFFYLLTDLEQHPEHSRIFWLIPLQLIWVNSHFFFFIGLAMVGGFLFEKIIINRKNLWGSPLIKKLVLLLLALIAISFINPNGIKGAFYPFFHLFDKYAFPLTEDLPLVTFLKTNPPSDISAEIFLPMALLLFLGFALFFWKRFRGSAQGSIFYFLASAGSAAAALFAMRCLGLFGLIFLPAAAFTFNGLFEKSKIWLERKPPKIASLSKKVLILFLIAALFFFAFLAGFGKISDKKLSLGLMPRSVDAATFLRQQNIKGPIFNDHDSGDYLIYYLYPEEKVFFDHRGPKDAYSDSFIRNTYLAMLQQEETWQEVTKKYNFNVIFFYADQAYFLMRRLADPSWALVYADAYAKILLKNTAENQEVINKFRISKENAAERLSYLLESGDLDDHIAAADIFNILGREDLAVSVFKDVLARRPNDGRLWLVLGETESALNGAPTDLLAVADLERAISLGQKDAETYTFLGLVYFRLSRFQEANNALQKALKLDPNRQDAKNYLTQLQKYLTPDNLQ